MHTTDLQAASMTKTPKTDESLAALPPSCRNLRVRTSVRAGAAMACPVC